MEVNYFRTILSRVGFIDADTATKRRLISNGTARLRAPTSYLKLNFDATFSVVRTPPHPRLGPGLGSTLYEFTTYAA